MFAPPSDLYSYIMVYLGYMKVKLISNDSGCLRDFFRFKTGVQF